MYRSFPLLFTRSIINYVAAAKQKRNHLIKKRQFQIELIARAVGFIGYRFVFPRRQVITEF